MPTTTFIAAFATLFATVSVADIAFIFAALTKRNTAKHRFGFATRSVIIAGIILGNAILDLFGITILALRTAGGLLLFLVAIDMVFARHSGGAGTADEEEVEARSRDNITVFPLVRPLLVGLGAISSIILLTTSMRPISNSGPCWRRWW